MSVFEELQIASFRGFEFLIESETKTGGKKIVSHEYPNSDKRFTEELGLIPSKFTINAVIFGQIKDRIAFEAVLNQPGLSTLVHPIYGSIKVKSTTYSVSSNQRQIGEFKFSVNFEVSESFIEPKPSIISEFVVSEQVTLAFAAIGNAFEKVYKDVPTPGTLDRLVAKADTIYDAVHDNISSVTGAIQSGIAGFTKIVSSAKQRIRSITQLGSTLVESFQDLYASALSIVNTPSELFDAWKTLTDFGWFTLSGDTSTVINATEFNNAIALTQMTQLTAFVNLQEASVYKDYDTDIEIDSIRTTINTIEQEIMKDIVVKKRVDVTTGVITNIVLTAEESSKLNLIVNDPDVQRTLAILKTSVIKLLQVKEQNSWKLVDLDPGLSSMSLVAYRFYGSLDNLDLIKKLNPEANVSNFNQIVKGISE